jgi:hypothetical protein
MTIRHLGSKWTRGQSFIELALLLPVLFLLLAGMVEVGFLFFSYMTAVDLTREAARFASTRDYTREVIGTTKEPYPMPLATCKDEELHFYYDTACFFVDPEINPSLQITSTEFEDVTISVFTVTNSVVTNRYPKGNGVWSLYDNNWQKDCLGNKILDVPFFTNEEVQSKFVASAPANRGLVLVEVFFCYHQIMKLPVLNWIMPDPMRIHTYTFMPFPEAIPSPTPILP